MFCAHDTEVYDKFPSEPHETESVSSGRFVLQQVVQSDDVEIAWKLAITTDMGECP